MVANGLPIIGNGIYCISITFFFLLHYIINKLHK